MTYQVFLLCILTSIISEIFLTEAAPQLSIDQKKFIEELDNMHGEIRRSLVNLGRSSRQHLKPSHRMEHEFFSAHDSGNFEHLNQQEPQPHHSYRSANSPQHEELNQKPHHSTFENSFRAKPTLMQRKIKHKPNFDFILRQPDNYENSNLQSISRSSPFLFQVPENLNFEYSRAKRQTALPLTKLVMDPRFKLNVPKTLENIGSLTRNAIEDKQAPLYHLREMMGSSRDTLLSAMRIPPYNLVHPSTYDIIDPTKERGATYDDADTFNRVCDVLRNSVKSTHATAVHVGEIAHNAKKMAHSVRHSLPKLIVPIVKVPAVEKVKAKPLKLGSGMVVGEHFMSENNENALNRVGESSQNGFVKFGHILDAFGFSDESKEAESELETLENARGVVGARNYGDFLVKMRATLNPEKPLQKFKKKNNDQQYGEFIETLFNSKRMKNTEEDFDDNEKNIQVVIDRKTLGDFARYLEERKNPTLRAINPIMYERMFQESLETNSKHQSPSFDVDPKNVTADEKIGMKMQLTKDMLTPFMGKIPKNDLYEMLDEYNDEDEYGNKFSGVDDNGELTYDDFDGTKSYKNKKTDANRKHELIDQSDWYSKILQQ